MKCAVTDALFVYYKPVFSPMCPDEKRVQLIVRECLIVQPSVWLCQAGYTSTEVRRNEDTFAADERDPVLLHLPVF